ncbi:MAG: ribosome biogenesis GTPase Der [Ectothiorhodospiraceae bacterium]|nr:ribosome biogenesis GTPase Der [Ectothiorhodospiraceae bacterium]
MKPVVALVGRPNVGKSTLFNCLTQSRDALVADQPGLTRDRKYGEGRVGDYPYLVIDTGGLSGEKEGLDELMADQSWLAVEEADLVLFMVDARDGLMAGDHEIAKRLRTSNKPVHLVVNKVDGAELAVVIADFYQLGLGNPLGITASQRGGVRDLMAEVLPELPESEFEEEEDNLGIKIAIVGKPNVGKSTLINRILGEERVLTFDMPGTTRDSIFVPFERRGERYTFIDTAGVRRRKKVHDKLEKFSVIKALQAIERAHVVVLVIDAHEGISDQDAHLLGFVLDEGRALVIAINKWDGLETSERERVKYELGRKLQFVDFAKLFFISALHGTGVGDLFKPIQKAYASATRQFTTPELTRILERAVENHQPPLVRGRRIKLRYAHQGGRNPPMIVIHGNQTKDVPDAYRRYLQNVYRKALQLEGTPVRIDFKTGVNPFEGRKNKLTKRQIDKRQRLKKFVKRKGN